jgi:radical SAM protein with 4Fe4S-binding SPASM domain
MFEYIKLAKKIVFKARYEHWYFITVGPHENERFWVDVDTAKLVLALLRGRKIKTVAEEFSLSSEELISFLDKLLEEKLIEYSEYSVDSTSCCFSLSPPLDSINALLTNACNLKCKHCYLQSGHCLANELTGKEWVTVLKQAQQLGVFGVNVSGGEPLLHKDFIEIAEYIASIQTFNANLNTNGTLINQGNIGLIAKAFSSVQISIDDVNAAKHDSIRGKQGSFQKAVQAIKKLVDLQVPVSLALTLMPENIASLASLVAFCDNLGVRTLNIGMVVNIGRASTNNLLPSADSSWQELNSYIDRMYLELRKLRDQHSNLKILLPFRINSTELQTDNGKRFICSGDHTQIIYVMADGTVMPCDKLPKEIFGYGNIREKSLKDLWLSSKMQEFKLMTPKHLPKCEKCHHLALCGGACVARAYQNGGSLESQDCLSCIVSQKFADEQCITITE